MDPVLHGHGLSFRVRGKQLLHGVDIGLHAGEIHAVVGRNGAGKSTLLKLLTGEMMPSAGSIGLDGRPLAVHKTRDLARRRAVLAQHTTLTFNYGVLEVALLGRLPHLKHGRETAEDITHARDALARVGLASLSDRGYLTLSGGEQQRVHLARVLAQLAGGEPQEKVPLLFLDEPTNNLDIHHQHQVLEIARELASAGAAVFAILHDLNLAARYADRVTLLQDGKLLATGTPATVFTPELLQRAFDHPVLVETHPIHRCPIVIPI
ncbi:heme ABC transporter ATP-binding protein [Luteolibacter flavescens]|nr:heme ABC transporter ATP-binding protein [Luteolibacter flavescens]